MATSKVTTCFSKISVKEFDTIEGAAQRLAESKGRAQAINADYAEVVRGIIGAKQAKLKSITTPVVQRPSESSVQQIAQSFVESFGEHAPPVHVVPNAKGVIPNADGTEKGAHYKGAIYIFSDNVRSAIDTARTLWHETFHYGLRTLFNREQFVEHMHNLYNRDAFIKEQADEWVATEDGKATAAAEGMDYAIARGVDEALANLGETNGGQYNKNGLMDRAYRAVLSWLADVSEALGAKSIAASIRGVKNQEARAFIQDVFARTKAGEGKAFNLQDSAQFSKPTPEQAKQAAAEKAKQEELLKDAVTNFPVAGPVSRPPQQLTKLISALPTSWRDPAMHVARVLTGKTGDAINAVAFTTDLIDRAVKLGMASAKKYMELHNKQSAMVGQHERKIQDISAQYMGIEEENKGVGKGTANQFLHDSTMSRKWGYDVEFTTTDEKGNAVVKKIQADPEMAKQFNALKPKAQAYVKAVFAYGREALQAKQQAVLDSVPSIYDSLIADETDPKLKQELIDAKADQIKQFGSLYRISGDTPYAPLKRFGKWIVVAKSKELAALTAKFESMQQGSEKETVRKMIRKMEGESKHQFNDHFDNEFEARAAEAKLAQLPQFQNGVVHTRARNEASLFEGSGTLNALRAIEAKLQDTPDGNHKRKMLRMVGDMYLSALSEDSARRNEMERLGVKADDPVTGNTRIDMQRAFESQGKADAFFLAHAAVGRDMQAVFKQMHTESNAGGDTRAKSSLYNELLLRRIQSLNYEDENWSHKVVRMASKYMLAFSPAYYMQNATQPWMVSLPIMAGRHEFGKTANVLASKYSQIAEAVKSAQLLGNLDYNKILAGISDTNERAFLKRALDEGIIDIGHGIELAANSHYDSKVSRAWGKVDQSIRNLQQKAEAINRITTALTAYELEMGKTGDVKAAEDYAERIVRETHGDYSAWNAPRAFNTNPGRVALQFRKYQLVQLTLMARLLKNTFAGASKEERAMARKAFGLMLGQAFLVGGAKALPMMAVVPALLAGAFGNGGDEPPEYLFRQWIGNKDVSDILLNGLPTKLTGMNLSKFGGMGQMLDILPFQNGLLPTDRSSAESFGYSILGGPAGGLSLRAMDGFTNIANGMWWKGIESFVPTGFANVSKAVRYGVEGDENKRGTLNLGKEEFNMFTLAAQSMGVQPGVVERRMYEQQTKYAIDIAFKDHANRLKAEYVRASRDGDSAAMADVRNKWMKMQEGQRADGIQPNPLSTLIKAPMEARKSEQQRQGTQVYSKKERDFGSRVSSY